MLQNQNKCHSEPNPQRLTYEESQKSEILRMQIQKSHSQNDTAFVGADSISARQRGITLIALVVTLVVLLILAGITSLSRLVVHFFNKLYKSGVVKSNAISLFI